MGQLVQLPLSEQSLTDDEDILQLQLLQDDLQRCSEAADNCVLHGLDALALNSDQRNVKLLEDTLAGVFASIRRIGGYYRLDEQRIAKKARDLLAEQAEQYSQRH